MVQMADVIQRVRTEVAEARTVAASAVALVRNVSQEIRERKNNIEALDQLADALDTSTNDLAAAVAESSDVITGGGGEAAAQPA